MIEHNINEIKIWRKRLGITQNELANISCVSQSMIAKIEAGLLDPTYTKAKSIFEALEKLEKKEQKKISEIMQKKVIGVKSNDTLKRVINVMRKNNISQMPVIENKNLVGIISETSILDSILEKNDPDALVKDIMRECPPMINLDASIDVASNLLKHYPLIMVSKKGTIIGIVTKADILNHAYKK